ncbi:unnamed protein product [Caenorhabditis sp. 36 PRJEB53466]|nr:unnamed protein product [Caenorhabditis sp. 36 PRJEB53466]
MPHPWGFGQAPSSPQQGTGDWMPSGSWPIGHDGPTQEIYHQQSISDTHFPDNHYGQSTSESASALVMTSPYDSEDPKHARYLSQFRVNPCQLFANRQCQKHRPFSCFNYHYANQRRRRPYRPDGTFAYSPELYCELYDDSTGRCPKGDNCQYLHRVAGDVERRYHPRYYKTAQCSHPNDEHGDCIKNGVHCAYAHTNDEKRPIPQNVDMNLNPNGRQPGFVKTAEEWLSPDYVLSHYKTTLCQVASLSCRQGYACSGFHNSKDRRRSPAQFFYKSTPCPAARGYNEWLSPESCKAGDTCPYCHTRTEQQFHPDVYKSSKCTDFLEHGFCPRAMFCAFAHHETELSKMWNPFVPKIVDELTADLGQLSLVHAEEPHAQPGWDSRRSSESVPLGTDHDTYEPPLVVHEPVAQHQTVEDLLAAVDEAAEFVENMREEDLGVEVELSGRSEAYARLFIKHLETRKIMENMVEIMRSSMILYRQALMSKTAMEKQVESLQQQLLEATHPLLTLASPLSLVIPQQGPSSSRPQFSPPVDVLGIGVLSAPACPRCGRDFVQTGANGPSSCPICPK